MFKKILPTAAGLAAAGIAMSFFLTTEVSDSTHTLVMLLVGLPVFLAVTLLTERFITNKKKRP